MLNRLADLIRLRAYADLLVQPVGRVGGSTLKNLAPGTQVMAIVGQLRADGSVRATIEGAEFDLRLPYRAAPGEQVPLRVAAREPQLRFALDPLPDAMRPAQLSDTARFINALLAESEKLPVAAKGAAPAPLLPAPPADSRAIAHALKGALADSGIFYEAHQAEWISDARPLAALRREPQARLAPLPPPEETAAAGPGAAGEGLPRLKELPVHRDALSIVRQQLETLESRQLVWHGTLWPGQTLEWEIGEDTPPAPALPAERVWRSRLRLTLPRLGEVDASLAVSGDGVRVDLRAQSAGAAGTLAAERIALQRALADAGVPALAIGVAHAGV